MQVFDKAVIPQGPCISYFGFVRRQGVGFPILRWVALLGLATGAVLDSAFGPYRGKQTGETALFRSLLKSLCLGDIVLADRYYCSYWLVALLQAQGVDVVFRKHHLRHTDFRSGRRLGEVREEVAAAGHRVW